MAGLIREDGWFFYDGLGLLIEKALTLQGEESSRRIGRRIHICLKGWCQQRV